MTEKQIQERVDFIREKLTKLGPGGGIVLATYTRDEFSELRPGENYDDFKKAERQISERIAAEGFAAQIVFQEVDSVGFYRFIGKHGYSNSEQYRSLYAVLKNGEKQDEYKGETK